MVATETIVARRIHVRGLVQGVGFRPFVYRLARLLGVRGWVRNDEAGAILHVEGDEERLERLLHHLHEDAPPAASISDVIAAEVEPCGLTAFTIESSVTGAGARVPLDRVACRLCVREVFAPADRRHGYALTTCTECGPRYSLVTAMPYDRPRTTLTDFPLCSACEAEYRDPADRRFHAQPIACPRCGPRVWLCDATGHEVAEAEAAFAAAADALHQGRIVAMKGLGGYQLLVRADDDAAVARLRQRKQRPTKPLAVLVRSLDVASELAVLSDAERELLASPAGPIVLVRKRSSVALAGAVAPHLNLVGLMLPTTTLHHLLLARLDCPLIATSGNASDEPIATDEVEAYERLRDIADAFLVHDRPIARRVDDSVTRVVAGQPLLMRLARGYAPQPLPALERWASRHLAGTTPVILAVGGQQKSALALYANGQAILGPHIGDLDSPLTRRAFREQTHALPSLFGCRAAVIACDAHPDYASTRWAEGTGLPVVQVQHHHAHSAAAMVEHDLLEQEVLALTWDGSGYGLDGTIWGGEAIRATLRGAQRIASLRPFVLPGGEAAIHEPARVTLALLVQVIGVEPDDLPALLGLSAPSIRALRQMIERGVNCPVTTSMGRLFDAVAVLALGATRVDHEGEAAAWLESAADDIDHGGYPLPQGDWRPLIRAVLADRRAGVAPGIIAARFHEAVIGWAIELAESSPELPLVLGGGCFQNARLVEGVIARLPGRAVYPARSLPPGDGGLAVGQLAVALAHLAKSTEEDHSCAWESPAG